MACVGVAIAALFSGCAAFGGSSSSRCKLRIESVQEWNLRSGALDATYRVSGEAGSPAEVWLVANAGGRNPVSGGSVDVGPGPFRADVTLRLTGVPRVLTAVLEVRDRDAVMPKRCRADAKIPTR